MDATHVPRPQPLFRSACECLENKRIVLRRDAAEIAGVILMNLDGPALDLRADASDVDTVTAGEPKRSEEHTSELQSLMRISYAVFCLKKKINRKVTKEKKM